MRDELKPLVSMYQCCVEADGRSEDQQNASRVRKLEESNLSREDLKFRGRRFDESEMSREHSKPDARLSWGRPLFSSSLDKDNSADVSRLVASVEVRKNSDNVTRRIIQGALLPCHHR